MELISAKDANHALHDLSVGANGSKRFVIDIKRTLDDNVVVETDERIDPKMLRPHPRATVHPKEANHNPPTIEK